MTEQHEQDGQCEAAVASANSSPYAAGVVVSRSNVESQPAIWRIFSRGRPPPSLAADGW
jgi:hypothetical protein